jgi:ParB family transcriptional regulator, chromosome partitioning protein
MADHSRLGRGLASLMGDVGEETTAPEQGRKARRAPIENLRANPRNPRRAFSETELNELADSIRERGIIQPIVVRSVRGEPDNFEIIAGERRWRAAQRAGLHEVPVAVVEATDAQALEFAIIENVQRADLNAIEEATGYLALMEEFNHSQDEVAQIVGKSRPHVANTLRLLKLSEPVQALVASGQLSAGHARMLVGQPNALELAQDIVKRGLNVRQVEAAMRKDGHAQSREVAGTSRAKDADTKALERRLSDALGLDVTVDHRGQGGTLHIKYRDLDQLDGVLRKLDRK